MKYFQKYSREDLEQIKENFKGELERAMMDEKSSLSSIKTTIPNSRIKNNIKIQVIVLGGTNYKLANIFNQGKEIFISKIKNGRVPDITSKDKFLRFLDTIINTEVDFLAINLAYPMEQYRRGNTIDAITGCFNN